MIKRVIIFITFKNDLFGCFRIEGEQDKDNETGLKEGRVIEISTTVAPFAMLALSLKYLPMLCEAMYRRRVTSVFQIQQFWPRHWVQYRHTTNSTHRPTRHLLTT